MCSSHFQSSSQTETQAESILSVWFFRHQTSYKCPSSYPVNTHDSNYAHLTMLLKTSGWNFQNYTGAPTSTGEYLTNTRWTS